MNISVMIATYNRYIDICDCIESVIKQSKLPSEIVIVDSTEINNENIEDYNKFKSFIDTIDNVNVKYVHPDEKGLTVQRNIGMKNINDNCDLIMFLDDDILLGKNYIEEIEKAFYNDEIIGAEGNLSRDGDRILKLNKKDKNLKSLYGCNMTYRYSKIKNMKFDEMLKLYSFMEDWDFSYRVGKKGKLVKVAKAIAIHNQSKAGRVDYKKLGFMRIANKYYLKKKNNAFTLYDAIYLTLTIIRNGICSFKKSRRERFIGNIIALKRIIIKKENIDIVTRI